MAKKSQSKNKEKTTITKNNNGEEVVVKKKEETKNERQEKKEHTLNKKLLIPAIVMSFVICFMLLIYEPTVMYAANIHDYWFDYGMLFKTMSIYCIIAFLLLSVLFSLVYLFNKKFFKGKPIYHIFYVIAMIAFISTYIQGNYLVGDLPVLSGDKIEWGNYLVNDIITIVILIILIIASIILCKKYKIEQYIKKSIYVSLAIFLMLVTSMIPSFFTENMFSSKIVADVTNININTASTDKNFLILLLDAVDARTFTELLNTGDYDGLLNDFTYYPDTTSAYAFTRDSIPFILSNKWNENEEDFLDYYKHAIDDSKLFKMLKEHEYDLNVYEEEYIMQTKLAEEISNIKKSSGGRKMFWLAKEETKYIMFRYLPYFAKKYTRIEKANLTSNYYDLTDNSLYHWYATTYYKQLSQKLTTTDKKMFKFTHVEGAHVPLNLDENFNFVEKGTYKQKVITSIKTIKRYLERLKDNDVYNNSVIIIMADHGYSYGNQVGRHNPLLLIKGIDEHHKMYVSDKQISFVNLMDAYEDLLNGKKSTELFKNVTNNEVRRYLLYNYKYENHMEEYEIKGKAWETDKIYKTGKTFDR